MIRLSRDEALVLSDWLHRMMGTADFDELVDRLPVPGRHPVLMLDSRHPAVEHKPQAAPPLVRWLRVGLRLAVEPSSQGRVQIVTRVV